MLNSWLILYWEEVLILERIYAAQLLKSLQNFCLANYYSGKNLFCLGRISVVTICFLFLIWFRSIKYERFSFRIFIPIQNANKTHEFWPIVWFNFYIFQVTATRLYSIKSRPAPVSILNLSITPHNGLWNIGMWHFNPNRSFESKMDPKSFNLIPKVIIVAPKTFQRFLFCIWEIFFKKFERFSLKCSNFVNFWARKTFFFLKQVRISPEIDWYHYQSANAAPTSIVRHRIKTDQFWRSVTSEPNVPPPCGLGKNI